MTDLVRVKLARIEEDDEPIFDIDDYRNSDTTPANRRRALSTLGRLSRKLRTLPTRLFNFGSPSIEKLVPQPEKLNESLKKHYLDFKELIDFEIITELRELSDAISGVEPSEHERVLKKFRLDCVND